MASQVLAKSWSDKSKACALTVLEQYAKFQGLPFQKPSFKAYDNKELYFQPLQWLDSSFIELGACSLELPC
jgi:hypothetical protein